MAMSSVSGRLAEDLSISIAKAHTLLLSKTRFAGPYVELCDWGGKDAVVGSFREEKEKNGSAYSVLKVKAGCSFSRYLCFGQK